MSLYYAMNRVIAAMSQFVALLFREIRSVSSKGVIFYFDIKKP